jgi:pimeloyl-ACP methyl ester carboxylesterase
VQQEQLINQIFEQFFFPPHYPTPPTEIPFLEKSYQYDLAYKDVNINVYEWGETTAEKAILLMHGWAGRATQLGYFIQPFLDAGYQVVGFDGTAHGKSGSPLRPTMRVLEFAEIILALSQKYDFQGLIAHSMGSGAGTIALGMGAKIQKAVFIGAPRHFPYRFEQIALKTNLPPELVELLKQKFTAELGADIWQKASSEYFAPHIKTPALFIHSEDDQELPFQESQYMAKIWGSQTQYSLKQGLGHTRILKDEKVIKETIDFIIN